MEQAHPGDPQVCPKVEGLGFGVGVEGLGVGVCGLGFRVWGLSLRFQDLGFRVSRLGRQNLAFELLRFYIQNPKPYKPQT
jgi:hypothetical protein